MTELFWLKPKLTKSGLSARSNFLKMSVINRLYSNRSTFWQILLVKNRFYMMISQQANELTGNFSYTPLK